MHVGTQLLKIEKKADSLFMFGIYLFFMKDIKEGTSTGTRDFLVVIHQNLYPSRTSEKGAISLQEQKTCYEVLLGL